MKLSAYSACTLKRPSYRSGTANKGGSGATWRWVVGWLVSGINYFEHIGSTGTPLASASCSFFLYNEANLRELVWYKFWICDLGDAASLMWKMPRTILQIGISSSFSLGFRQTGHGRGWWTGMEHGAWNLGRDCRGEERELLGLSRTSLGARDTERRPKVRRRTGDLVATQKSHDNQPTQTHTHTNFTLFIYSSAPYGLLQQPLPRTTRSCDSARCDRSRTLRRTWGGKISPSPLRARERKRGRHQLEQEWKSPVVVSSATYSTRGRTRTGLLRVSPSSR